MNFNLQESHLQLHCTYEQWRSTCMNLPNSLITFQKLNLGNFNLKNTLNSNHLQNHSTSGAVCMYLKSILVFV